MRSGSTSKMNAHGWGLWDGVWTSCQWTSITVFSGTRALNSWRRMAPSHPRSPVQPADLMSALSFCKDWQTRSRCNCMSVSHCQTNQKLLSQAHLLCEPVLALHLLTVHCTLLHPAQLSLFRRFLQEELSFPKMNFFLSMHSDRHAQSEKSVNRYEGRARNLSFPRLVNL